MWKWLTSPSLALIEQPSTPGRRVSDHPVQINDIRNAGEFDAAWHVVTIAHSPMTEWDDELQYHRTVYPYEARPATEEDLERERRGQR